MKPRWGVFEVEGMKLWCFRIVSSSVRRWSLLSIGLQRRAETGRISTIRMPTSGRVEARREKVGM